MEWNFLLYVAIIALYIIFFVFLFMDNIEGLIFILLFLLTTMSGYKVVMDLYENREIVNYDIMNMFDFLEEPFKIKSAALHPIVLLLLTVSLVIFIFMYMASRVSANYVITNAMLLVLYFLFSMPAKEGASFFQLYVLYGVPILGIILSLVFIMVCISVMNFDSPTGEIELNKKYRMIMNRYKGLLTATITIIMGSLLSITYLCRYDKNNKIPKDNNAMNLITTIGLVLSYGLSYASLNTSYVFYEASKFNMQKIRKPLPKKKC